MKNKITPKKDKIGILSLGCSRNLVDSENIAGRLNLKNYDIVDIEEADTAIINTCAFIEEAKKESIEAILDLAELKKEGKLKKIIVYGCLPQRYKDELRKELPEVDAFIGRVSLNHDLKRFSITPRHYAYLKVCEGCINKCSFCVIPRIKGRFVSLDMKSILNKIAVFDKDKVSEVNIIGQDITAYGIDLYGSIKLTEVLKKIIKKAKHIGWIRLLYLNPQRITDDLLQVIKDSPQVCKYIDLPVQHINRRILKLMQRQASSKEILTLIDKIRKAIPGVALRTSIIAGFPSETENDFKELLNFIETVKFERLGAFVYSREEGTTAYNFKTQLPEKTKTARLDMIMSLQQKISQELNRKFLGRTLRVLIDEGQGQDKYLGRSQYDAPEVDGLVYINSKRKLSPGQFIEAKITDTLEYDLVGQV
jgi:ribosomal protein S12 methylthiotransferase